MQHREHGGARSTHERGLNFKLLSQPHLEFSKEEKLFENRAFQVVHQVHSIDALRFVTHIGKFTRFAPAAIGIDRVHPKPWFQQQHVARHGAPGASSRALALPRDPL